MLYQRCAGWDARVALPPWAASQRKIRKLDPSPKDFDFLICFLLDLAIF